MDRTIQQDWAPRYRSQYWNRDPQSHNTVGSTFTDGDMHYVPLIVYRQTLFDSVGLQVTTGGVNATCDIGLYAAGHTQNLAMLMTSATGLSLAAIATVTSSVRWYIPAGFYYLGARYADPSGSGPAVATIRRVTGLPYLGQSSLASLNITGYYASTGNASLPSAVQISTLSAGTGSNAISVMVRAA